MPLYDYFCSKCGNEMEKFYAIAHFPMTTKCQCGSRAKKVLSNGHGGIQCDSENDVKWLPDARKLLQPDCERPVQTRGEYKKYLKDNGIMAKC